MLRSSATLLLVVAAAGCAVSGAGTTKEPTAAVLLGAPPLCEASAAVPSPYAPGKILVGDNEVSEALFEFSLVSGRLESQTAWPLPKGIPPSDIEAIAVSRDTLWIFGSHSRNKFCEIKPRRQRVLVIRRDPDSGRAVPVKLLDTSRMWRAGTSSVGSCLRVFFTDPAPALATEACRAIVEAERLARPGAAACETFNIEGAVAVPDPRPAKGDRLWIGLRAPRVEGSAILLRLASGADSLRFDGIALVSLGGAGIRELALRGGTVWGIAGPPADRTAGAFRMFRVEKSRLENGAKLDPEWLTEELPPSSESVVFDGDTPIVLQDGDRGSKGARACLVPSHQARIEPRPARP